MEKRYSVGQLVGSCNINESPAILSPDVTTDVTFAVCIFCIYIVSVADNALDSIPVI